MVFSTGGVYDKSENFSLADFFAFLVPYPPITSVRTSPRGSRTVLCRTHHSHKLHSEKFRVAGVDDPDDDDGGDGM